MPLIRTLIARCEEPGCEAEVELDSQTTQPYRDLAEQGWSNHATTAGMETYCPDHPANERERAREVGAMNWRLQHLMDFASQHGLAQRKSTLVKDCYGVRLDAYRQLTFYGEPNNAVDVYLIDDDRNEYEQITQRRARDLMRESVESA